MSRNLPVEMTTNEAQKFEALLDELIVQIKRARKQMAKDQAEIDRLKVSTRAKLDALKRELKVS